MPSLLKCIFSHSIFHIICYLYLQTHPSSEPKTSLTSTIFDLIADPNEEMEPSPKVPLIKISTKSTLHITFVAMSFYVQIGDTKKVEEAKETKSLSQDLSLVPQVVSSCLEGAEVELVGRTLNF